MYVVALSRGLRVSELLASGWDDVDLDPADGGDVEITVATRADLAVHALTICQDWDLPEWATR